MPRRSGFLHITNTAVDRAIQEEIKFCGHGRCKDGDQGTGVRNVANRTIEYEPALVCKDFAGFERATPLSCSAFTH